MSVTSITVAQLRTYEANPSQNAAGSGNSYTVVDTAQNLESLSQSDINEMPSIGATAIAASDTPAVMSANQMTWLVNNSIPITVPPNTTPQNSNDGITDLPNPNGLTIDITWDPSVASAPASFKTTIEQGAEILEQTISNQFTFNIDVGYAEVGGGVNSGANLQALPGNISAANISFQQDYQLTYSQLLSDLTQGEASESATSSAQLTSTNDLPNTTSLNGQSNFYIGSAEAKALTADDPTLNLISPTATTIDGAAGFGLGFSGTGLVGAVLHEFTHAMGRVPGTTALSLFQYLSNSSTPTHDFNNGNPSTTNPAPASYFSIDGGVTTLAQFGTTSDQSDFLNSPASSLTPNDPFDEGVAGSGQLTSQDLVMLNVLGFQINPVESFSSSYIQGLSLNDVLLMLSVGITELQGGSLPQVAGTAAEIQSLTPQQITAIGDLGIGVTSLSSDGSVQLNAAQAEAFEAANIGITVPSGDTVTLNDTASHIKALTVSEIDALAGIGVNIIHATDGSVVLSLAQALALEGTPLSVTVPGGDTVTVADTAANIESLTLSEIAGLPAIGISGIKVTDTSVTITIDQATALEAASLSLKVPSGATVTIFDETEGGLIERLTPAQIEALPSISATVLTINVNDLPLAINVADAVAIESVGATVVFPDPTSLNFTYIYDTGANLGLLTPAEIAALPAAGFRALWASDPSDYPGGLPLTVAQAVALENASLLVRGPSVFTPVIDLVDSAANLETLTAVQILKLPPISRGQETFNLLESGPINVTSTAQPLGFSVAQLDAFLETGLQFVFSVEGGGAVTISDTAENISLFLLLHTQAQLNELRGDGFTGVVATDMSLQLSVADAVKLETAGLTAAAPAGDAVTILDIGPDIEILTAQQISLLPTIGVTGISSFSPVQLNVAQAVALEQASLVVTAPAGDTVSVDDTIANLESLTPGELSGLTGIGVTGLGVVDTAGNIEALTPAEIATLKSEGLTAITASDASVELTVVQAVALEDPVYITAPAGDSVTLADTASDILGLNASEAAGLGSIGITAIAIVDTAGDIEALTADQIAALGSDNLAKITATDASVKFSVAEAVALENAFIVVTAPLGDGVAIADTAADIETLTPTELGALHSVGITAIVAVDRSAQFTAAQALALEGGSIVVTAPAGDTVALLDTAADIETMSPAQLDGLENIGITAVWVSDQSLTASGAEALENTYAADAATGAPPPFRSPPGQILTLADTAADIQGMSPAQLGALTSIGVTAVTVTDGSITLTVAQALALYDPVPISVPPGDSVIIADTTAEIESLTPTEIAGLAAIGVNTIDVSGLSGGESLTINGGITLAVDGAVPSGDTITFTGTGGVLSLDDTVDMAGTIYGFSPPDTIDLTDAQYDTTGNGSASLGTDPNDNQQSIVVTENSNTYYLDIDPTQVFLTGATFNLNPDDGGLGTGSDLTVVEPPVTSYDWVYPGQTADGVVVGSGGTVEVESGGTVNRTIVQGGGVLMADDGASINDTVLNDGTVDFDIAGSAVFSGPLTGTGILEVSGGGDLDVASAYTGAAQIDGSSTLEFTSTYFGVATFGGSSAGPGGTLQFDAGSTGPINVVNPSDTVIAQPGSDSWINAIVNYTLPANIDTLFLYAGSQGTGNSDALGDALYALDGNHAQTLTGNSANDTFVVYNSFDVVVPTAGSHDVVYAAASYTLPAGIDALILEGTATSGTGNSDAAGDALYAANPGQVATLTGNSANDVFVVYNSSDVVVPKTGSHDVVYSAVNYTLPTGVDVLFLEAGTQGVGNSDASGDALYAADAGISQTLIGNSANDTFVVYNSSDVVVPEAGSHDIVYSAVSYTLPTGVDSLILEGSATQGVGNSDAAGDTLYAANTNQVATLTGNSHNDTFVVYNSADTVIGQAGSNDTVYTAADFTLPANVDTLFLEGNASHGTGNSDAVDALFGNGSVASTLVAGSGADTLYVTGTTGTILTGGTGHDTFAFPKAMGHDEVTNFGIAKDTLQFNATLFANFTAAMNHASQSGANTVFTIDANDTVTLDNVTKTSLTAGNFHFT